MKPRIDQRKPEIATSPRKGAGLCPLALCVVSLAALGAPGCGSLKSVFVSDPASQAASGPISNPFGDYAATPAGRDSNTDVIFRSRRGDRSVEVEVPKNGQGVADFSMPVASALGGARDSVARSPASGSPVYAPAGTDGENELSYGKTRMGVADREIAGTFPHNAPADEAKRREVEHGLGLVPAEEETPEADHSYLAGIDHAKQLYRAGRFEAALIENDEMLRAYPTDPKLYEMRGTLLDRVGKPELALRAWQQALRLNPRNASLKKFIERRLPASIPSNAGGNP